MGEQIAPKEPVKDMPLEGDPLLRVADLYDLGDLRALLLHEAGYRARC